MDSVLKLSVYYQISDQEYQGKEFGLNKDFKVLGSDFGLIQTPATSQANQPNNSLTLYTARHCTANINLDTAPLGVGRRATRRMLTTAMATTTPSLASSLSCSLPYFPVGLLAAGGCGCRFQLSCSSALSSPSDFSVWCHWTLQWNGMCIVPRSGYIRL